MSKSPLSALQGFVSAARSKNLSRAAETMHVTVSALSHQMRTLEERLGRRLLDRGPRGIALTGDGQQLFDAVAPHFDAIERALRPFRARREEVLTLSVMPRVASAWLVPRLPRFVAAHPDIELNIQSSTDLVDFERDTGIDVAIRFGRGQWPGTEAVHLFDEWIKPVAAPALAKKLGAYSPEKVSGWPLLGIASDRWPSWFKEFGGKPPSRFVANFSDSETLIKAAVEGLGVALAPMTLARPMFEAGKLVPLADACQRSEYAHYLVYPARAESCRGLRVFRDWIVAEARIYSSSKDARGAQVGRTPSPALNRPTAGRSNGLPR